MIGQVSIEPISLDEEEDGFSGWGLDEVLNVSAAVPAPPLFYLSDKFPVDIAEQLRLAFQFFWSDFASCVGRLRTSVELMLDEQGVANHRLDKKSSKLVRLSLYERIDLFSKANATGDSESLHALRNIGNLGVHGDSVQQAALFDALDVLEDVLLGVYEKGSIKAKAKKLNDTKGNYPS